MVLFNKKSKETAEVGTSRGVPHSPASKPKSILKAPNSQRAILWCSINRDATTMARVLTNPPHPEAPRLAQQAMQSPANSGWEYFSFGQDEYKPGFRACKFHAHQRNPFPAGERVSIRGHSDAKLNSQTVQILSYSPATDHYVVQKSSGERISLCSEYVAGQSGRENIVWSYVCVYNNRLISQGAVCSFLEKLAMISDGFRQEWVHGKRLCGQEVFGEIIENQVDFYDALGKDSFHDDSLDFAKSVISANQELMSEGCF